MLTQKQNDKGQYWNEGLRLVDGCTPVSEGCENCWSRAMALRFGGQPTDGSIVVRPERLERILSDKPKVFSIWNDLFHENVPYGFICYVLDFANSCNHHTCIFLTKRAKRMLEFFKWHKELQPMIDWRRYRNLIFGVTAENQQRADERIPILLQIPTAKRFVSCEPILEEVDVASWGWRNTIKGMHPRVDWVVVGCETGQKARITDQTINHIRSVVRQCKEADVPVWVKAVPVKINGKWRPVVDWRKWPESYDDLRVREFVQ